MSDKRVWCFHRAAWSHERHSSSAIYCALCVIGACFVAFARPVFNGEAFRVIGACFVAFARRGFKGEVRPFGEGFVRGDGKLFFGWFCKVARTDSVVGSVAWPSLVRNGTSSSASKPR